MSESASLPKTPNLKEIQRRATALPLNLFNTETRCKSPLKPQRDNCVRMYACGPTVYNFAHIGNLRTYVFEDLLRRSIQFFGMDIYHVMNLTDVDDKTIKGALEQGVDLNTFTQTFKDAFFEDIDALSIQRAEQYPAATEFIPEMIEFIHKLLEKEVAYQGNDKSIYFSIKKFPRYGCLSHLNLDELKVGASERVDNDEYDKDNISDFVLWKAYDKDRDGNIFWESPFGPGRPGWHLECSTMAMKLLGDTLDIHAGGVDNIFPHHENEIAQSEACSGKPFSCLWMHSEHLICDNKKMSKSLGNFFTLRDLLKKGFTGPEVRYMLLQTHYKTQLNFTLVGLQSAKASLTRLQDFIYRLQSIEGQQRYPALLNILDTAYFNFATALADDLNISVALSSVFQLLKEVNILCDEGKIGKEDAIVLLNVLQHFNEVLGVLSFESPNPEIPQELVEALEQRNQAREEKNWARADELRDFIHSHGYLIEDAPTGTHLKKAS